MALSPALMAAIAALAIWWLSTGAILMAVRVAEPHGVRGGLWATLLGLPFLAAGAWGFLYALQMDTVLGAYVAFLSVIALWGWVELTFLVGTITGPMGHPCPPGRPVLERFLRAWGTLAYHELALAGLMSFALIASMGAPNRFGVWTMGVLYFARISAKLNLFFGVPYIPTDFLPRHLAHLPSHFRTARMNALFPISVTVLTFVMACWLERLLAAEGAFGQAGFALLAALTALALLEHWFLFLPLPDAKLWRWMLPAPKQIPTKGDIHEI